MQSDISNEVSTDLTAIIIQLNELRSKFDHGMREGHSASDLKEIYLQIKELECYLKALQWEPEKNTAFFQSWMR
ncbi:MAG TPA: hypothetical protein VM101_03685 [Flavitalea sp.]|nr:hypothetical protein [Flavitalea sp.]